MMAATEILKPEIQIGLIPKEQITGFILAGGGSKRMGCDKGLIKFKGAAFTTHIARAMNPLTKKVVLVTGNPKYDTLGYQIINDFYPHSGPLGALLTALSHSSTAFNLILSCDVPLVTSSLLQKLVSKQSKDFEAVLFKEAGKNVPLVAFYNRSCLKKCTKLWASGERRLQELLKICRVKTIIPTPAEAGCLKNINTPAQFESIKSKI